GKLLAAMQYDGTAHFLDAATGQELRAVKRKDDKSRTITNWLTFSPDGRFLAATMNGKVIDLIDVEKAEAVRSFTHPNAVYAAAFSPDGKLLAAGGYDSPKYFIRLWDVATGAEVRKFDGHALTGAVHGAIVRWDAATGKPRTPAGGDAVVSRVLATPDGQRVVTYDRAGGVRIWDAATGTERRRIDAADQHAIALSPDGR